ncbi:sulfatase-like hydrolase/transferase [Opitutus sp. ER46]|uniref:LTA synthase family protein n=1 Tax=Opitutus sp. ER46 TaxID=2161864 RepID=UPI000D2F5EF9|nr:sulfatase-like hydrolase/transferase [Opitutus sp. ER46]PTX91680.1 hypothetical protein DB354_17590 [Opitutus sp. ER46]
MPSADLPKAAEPNRAAARPSRPTGAWNFLRPLGHPLLLSVLILLAVRAVAVTWHYFGNGLDGRPQVSSPISLYGTALSYQLAVPLTLGLGLLLLWRLCSRLRIALVVLTAVVAGLLMLMDQVDFSLVRFVARRFSPSVLTAYGVPALASPTTALSLWHDAGHTLYSLGLLGTGWSLLALVTWRARHARTAPPWSWAWYGAGIVIAGSLYVAPMGRAAPRRTLMQPVEITFLRDLGPGEHEATPIHLAEAAERVRHRLLSPAVGDFVSDAHPLLHRPGPVPAGAGTDLPDIIVIAVESLHGRHLGFIRHQEPSPTPNLDALARESVVFPQFIANGYPSAPGFFSLHTGTLPHRSREVCAEFTGVSFDSLPARLRMRGYHTTAIWGCDAGFGNEEAWARRWYDDVDVLLPANRLGLAPIRGDAETFRVLREHMADGDRLRPGTPQFYFVANAGTHGPFTTAGAYFSDPADQQEAAPYAGQHQGDRAENFDAMLGLLDRQIGRLRAFFATRPRANRTVILICGDHSVSIAEPVADDIAAFPLDSTVWTAALLYGPGDLVGPPRVEAFPASQVDVMPTLLGLVGDTAPTAAMGVSLLAPIPAHERIAVAIRETGFRLDRTGWSLFVDATDPTNTFIHRSFSDLPRTRASEGSGPFLPGDAQALYAAVHAWSWLIEQDRVWPRDGQSHATSAELQGGTR